MPNISDPAGALTTWLSSNGVALAITAIALFVLYRLARPLVHRLLVEIIRPQTASGMASDAAIESETSKRVATIEDLLARLLKIAVVAAIIVVILGAFNLWPLVAGLGLVLAGLTVAGQAIILDYLMGILILIEGQYYKGDTIRVNDIQGEVEDVGLRRTVIRDPRGTVHSISNGLIRASSNLTRTYATAMIHIYGVAEADIERAITVMDDVGRGLADDPVLAPSLEDVPGYTRTTKLTAAGATLRMAGRVDPEARLEVETEMRRRVAAGLAAAGIELVRPVGIGDAMGAGPGENAPVD